MIRSAITGGGLSCRDENSSSCVNVSDLSILQFEMIEQRTTDNGQYKLIPHW